MKLHRKFVFALLGVATFCVAIDSSALTLGRAKGAVFLGQALKLTVPAQVESGEGASALCFEADVFYGDIRQEASRVGVASEYLPQAQTVNLTITAASIVNEPVVTVYLRAGCEHKISRRYVVLSELAPNTPQAPNLAAVPLPSSAPSAAAPISPSAASDSGVAKAAQTARKPRPERPAAVQAAPRIPKATSRRAHLKLEPWDLGPEREPVLKSSNELLLGEGDDLQKRAHAAAVWRSLNVTPQDIKDADSRAQTLANGLKGLRDTTVKNRQVLEELTHKLNKAESERYANGAVFGLLLLLLMCGAGLAYVWLRSRSVGLDPEPWYGDERQVAAAEPEVPRPQRNKTVASSDEAPQQEDATVAQPAVPKAAVEQANSGVGGVDIDLHLENPEDVQEQWNEAYRTHGSVQTSPSRASASGGVRHADFASSMSATLRAVNTKEMLDVRQQAEFFMTLGQHEEAIALLSENVAIASEADPLVYLDLLKILHTLGRKVEYDRYRSGFNAIFNGYVPVYADFNQTGSGLEAYPQVCKRIVALWPTEAAVDYIETCLVRADHSSSASGSQQLFDLGALHDLLMLHGVARRIASSSFDSGLMPFSTAKSHHLDGPEALNTQPVPVSPVAPAAGSVDFDLSDPSGNLIDFDSSDLLPTTPSAAPAKRRG